MEILLHPLVLFEIVLGCIIGAIPRWPILRMLTWFVIPPTIALTYSIANGLFTEHGEAGFFAAMGILVLLPCGFLAYGAALLLGYFLRKGYQYCENADDT